MSKVISAIFENGVFKPLQKVHIKEHQKVELKILSHDEWQKRFNRIIEKIHKKATLYTQDEIDADIVHAIKEVRTKASDSKDGY